MNLMISTFFNSWIALPFTFCITTFCVLIYCVEFRLDFVVNFVPHLIDVDPPYSNQTIHYYGYLQCPMCCNVKNPEAKEEQANGWFASVSSITFEDSLDKDACSRYAVSLAPLLITLLRLVWLRVCTLYLRAFRSRVRLNIANEPALPFQNVLHAFKLMISRLFPAFLNLNSWSEFACELQWSYVMPGQVFFTMGPCRLDFCYTSRECTRLLLGLSQTVQHVLHLS